MPNISAFDSPGWLVNSLVEYRVDITTLRYSHELLEEEFNQIIPTFTIDYISASIEKDIINKKIEITNSYGLNMNSNREGIISMIYNSEPQTRWIGFTATGGESWGSTCNANWDRYIKYYTIGSTHEYLYIESKYKSRINYFINIIDIIGYKIISKKSIKFKSILPWEVAYWKTLPNCFQCRAEFKTIKSNHKRNSKEYNKFNEFVRWHDCV